MSGTRSKDRTKKKDNNNSLYDENVGMLGARLKCNTFKTVSFVLNYIYLKGSVEILCLL